ncbi:MAG: hypothetical protein LBR80_00665 [Deltaproteobacteria bacterium]|nr:hypothetical protein [Deltaproteobacteria bacterium]
MTKMDRKVRDANEAGIALSQDLLVELLLAPLGHVPVDPVPTTEDYFKQMRILSEKTEDPDILAMAYLGLSARGNINTAEMMKGFLEMLIKIGSNVIPAGRCIDRRWVFDHQGEVRFRNREESVSGGDKQVSG